ncbi:hypothetical protein C1752_08717 [Acaryochloris thomasi RCC1774]|uniref:Uncharacterized protein n=1 Tax=Acaryochloris thomasi RCC1774 TaxID=1764569 RepID=A0A2W1JIQ8_9CYAN|nr:hypothetical protein [Acaryochloris thomasi]PZD70942.1 hypothetical protein C1752_08717 [Acaryochloris thomasi RCC1774]
MPQQHPFYLLWSGAINLGDTPGVFNNAQFAGLLVQIPVTLSFIPENDLPVRFLLKTSDVEIFNDKKHPVFWDWEPGTALPSPVGYVDDTDLIPEQPEFHELSVPHSAAAVGPHTITLQVNSEVSAGLRDDFVLECIEAHETIGAKIGW